MDRADLRVAGLLNRGCLDAAIDRDEPHRALAADLRSKGKPGGGFSPVLRAR
jgi:hypothetical protein